MGQRATAFSRQPDPAPSGLAVSQWPRCRPIAVVMCLGLSLPLGCATTSSLQPKPSPASDPRAADTDQVSGSRAVMPQPLRFLDDGFAYVDGRTGVSLSRAELVARTEAAQVILVGEQHDQAAHHELQASIIRSLRARGERLAVGLEMVDWSKQAVLDRLNRREIDVDGLFAALRWEESWGFGTELYRPIFDAGLDAGALFLGLNAPRQLVRAVAKQGVDGLSEEERANLPELDLGDATHRAEIEAVFQHHHPPTGAGGAFERFYAAQVLWDETMAEQTVKALVGGREKIVVIVGVGHVAGYRGVPNRILRRQPDARLLTLVPVSLDEHEELPKVMEGLLREPTADILVFRQPREVIAL